MRAGVENPLVALKNFPDPEYARNVCKWGTSARCRYLTAPADELIKPSCVRQASSISTKSMVDSKQSHMPINCSGILSKVAELSEYLVGKPVVYEDFDLIRQEGTLLGLTVTGNQIKLICDWLPDGLDIEPAYTAPAFRVNGKGISFEQAGLLVPDCTTILFEKEAVVAGQPSGVNRILNSVRTFLHI